MEASESVKILNEFYKLCENNRLNVNGDIFDELEQVFIKKHPQVKLFFCDNDTFSTSLLVVIPLGETSFAVIYLDQHNNDIVRLNISKERLQILTQGLSSLI